MSELDEWERRDKAGEFWEKTLKLPCRSYNGAIDQHIYQIAKAIVEARENDTSVFNTELAERFKLTPEYVELIQYVLVDLDYPPIEGESHTEDAFTYGTSPRGLFVDNMRMAKLFLKEFEEYYYNQWDERL